MAQDPKRTLKTLSQYKYHQDRKDDPLRAFKSFRIFTIAGLIGFAAMVVFLFYLESTSTQASRAQADLEKEFHLITHPPEVIPHDYYASHKMQHALVIEKFTTTLSYQEVHNYYNNELTKHGWKLIKEEPSYRQGKDFGETLLYYRKGNYTAALEYNGDKGDSGSNYALSLSWGLHDDF